MEIKKFIKQLIKALDIQKRSYTSIFAWFHYQIGTVQVYFEPKLLQLWEMTNTFLMPSARDSCQNKWTDTKRAK